MRNLCLDKHIFLHFYMDCLFLRFGGLEVGANSMVGEVSLTGASRGVVSAGLI